jgi:chromosome segregation ATPase
MELLKRDLNMETEALASELKILNENVHEKEVQIKTLSSELHSVRVNLNESKVLIEEYAKSNRSLESTLEIYEQNLTLKAKEIESMTNNSAFSKNEFNNYLKLTYGTICDMLTTNLKTLESIPSDASDNLNLIQLHSMTKLLKQALCEKLELNGGEIAILKVQLEEQKKSMEEKIQKIEILNEELQKYQGEYSSVRDQAEKGYSEMKQLLENNEALISDLETVNEDLRSSLSKAQQSILEKNQELTSLRLTNEKLVIQLDEVESGHDVLRKRIEKLENEQFEDLQQRASKVVSTRDAALQTRLDVKDKQCQTFINSVKSYSNATTQVTSSTDSAAHEEVVKLKKQLKKYELSRQFYKKKLHDVDQELMSNQDVIMRLEEKIATLSQAQSMRQSQENIHSRLNDNDKNLVDDNTAYGILANSHDSKKNGKVVSEAQMKKIIQHYENRLGKLYKLVKKGDEALGTTEKLFFGTRATENVL